MDSQRDSDDIEDLEVGMQFASYEAAQDFINKWCAKNKHIE